MDERTVSKFIFTIVLNALVTQKRGQSLQERSRRRCGLAFEWTHFVCRRFGSKSRAN